MKKYGALLNFLFFVLGLFAMAIFNWGYQNYIFRANATADRISLLQRIVNEHDAVLKGQVNILANQQKTIGSNMSRIAELESAFKGKQSWHYNPNSPKGGILEVALAGVPVIVTAYTAEAAQTDSTPFITASNIHVREGIVALSRDLERELGLKFGDRVRLGNIGVFEFHDRMHRKWKRRADIFMWSKRAAIKFGLVKTTLFAQEDKNNGQRQKETL